MIILVDGCQSKKRCWKSSFHDREREENPHSIITLHDGTYRKASHHPKKNIWVLRPQEN